MTKTKRISLCTSLLLFSVTLAQAYSGGPDAFGYTFRDSAALDGPIYHFEDISATGKSWTLEDDEMSPAIDIGFDFNYYGIDYNQVYVSSNGFLTVLDGQYPDYEGQYLPTYGDPDGVIAGWWTDLDPEEGGSIHTQTLGLAPNRYFVVQFTDIPFLGSSSVTTHQYKLFEGSNVIEVHYTEAPDEDNPTAGIEDETGSDGLTYAEDIFLETPIAVQYLPPASDLACETAYPSQNRLWPPDHRFESIEISGIEDPTGTHVLITIDSIFQDEPLDSLGDGNTEPDAWGVGSSVAHLRAERSGNVNVPGDGRVYHIGFTATGGQGECSGVVIVGVPHDRGKKGSIIVDGGPLYDSTQ